LPIILFDFHVWTLGRSIDVVSGKFSGWNLMPATVSTRVSLLLPSHSCSLGSWLLSLNQPVHACHRSSFPQRSGDHTTLFGSLEPQTPKQWIIGWFRIHFKQIDCSPWFIGVFVHFA
jgi:hypothetical protein